MYRNYYVSRNITQQKAGNKWTKIKQIFIWMTAFYCSVIQFEITQLHATFPRQPPRSCLNIFRLVYPPRKESLRKCYCFIIFGLEFMTIWSMDPFVWTSSHHNLYYFETAFTQLLSTVNTWKLKWWLIFRW